MFLIKKLIFVIFFLVAVWCSDLDAEFKSRQLLDHNFNACKEWKASDWEAFKKFVMADYPNEDRMNNRLYSFAKKAEKCSLAIDSMNITSCLERLLYLGKIVNRSNASRIHAWKTNLDYFRSQDERLVGLPKEFKYGFPRNWKDIVRRKGWKCVSFRSKLSTATGISEPYDRAMYRSVVLRPIQVDGKHVMQRIMVVSLTQDPSEYPVTYQIIATEHEYAERRQEGGDKGARMHYRAYDALRNGMTLSHSNNSCAECHMTGPIRIKPDLNESAQFCGDYNLDQFNVELLKDSTTPNQDQVLDTRLHPQVELGQFSIGADGSVGRAGEGSVRCADCHNSLWGERKPLLVAMALEKPLTRLPQWFREVLYIHENMPPGVTLNAQQTSQIYYKLLGEQIRGVRKWVEQIKCEDKPQIEKPLGSPSLEGAES